MSTPSSWTAYSSEGRFNPNDRIVELRVRQQVSRRLDAVVATDSATVASVEHMLRLERKPGNAARCPLGCTDTAYCQRTGCVCAYPEDGAA